MMFDYQFTHCDELLVAHRPFHEVDGRANELDVGRDVTLGRVLAVDGDVGKGALG